MGLVSLKRIQALADEVTRSIGTDPVRVRLDDAPDPSWEPNEEVLMFPRTDDLGLSEVAMRSVIAHELGHRDLMHTAYVFTPHDVILHMEEEADEFAAQHGYALGLAEALTIYRDRFVQPPDDTHPPIMERIAFLTDYKPAKGVGA